MDSLITAAGRALALGDPLGALKRVALRDDPPALALRGLAMAQLGDLGRAKALLKSAAQAFGSREAVARARCIVAEAEIALVSRDLHWRPKAVEAARATLEAHGDRANAAHARYLEVRRLLLIGRLKEAERALNKLDPSSLPPPLQTAHQLAAAGLAIRHLHVDEARSALTYAAAAASRARIPALIAEVDAAWAVLKSPAACLLNRHGRRTLLLDQIASLLRSDALVIDACRNVVRSGATVVSLGTRPVLFALARALAEAWPDDVGRDVLIARAFEARLVDESHRARLRVEITRFRAAVRTLASVHATKHGFRLSPQGASEVSVLTSPAGDDHSDVLALLADGESWSSSALALALGTSQRTVQRTLDGLSERGKIQSVSRGRSRRWMTPLAVGFTTTLLLPISLVDP